MNPVYFPYITNIRKIAKNTFIFQTLRMFQIMTLSVTNKNKLTVRL